MQVSIIMFCVFLMFMLFLVIQTKSYLKFIDAYRILSSLILIIAFHINIGVNSSFVVDLPKDEIEFNIQNDTVLFSYEDNKYKTYIKNMNFDSLSFKKINRIGYYNKDTTTSTVRIFHKGERFYVENI